MTISDIGPLCNDFCESASDRALPPLPARVVIVGAGTIGPDIGYYLKAAIPELTLHLVDVAQAPLDRAVQRFETYARKAVERGKLSKAQAEKITQNLHATQDYAVVKDADWVIEAATENLKLKRRIFARLEALMPPDAMLTSNTSSLPPSGYSPSYPRSIAPR
ncbi:MAG: 3-hydroxyacyl-CoA dehydrogenase NAD-binding domain-containing protein [Xanthobacteraceae bacterium]